MGTSRREASRCCTSGPPYDGPKLGVVFNLSGSEVVVLLLLALIVLGPERLPDAIRSFGRVYGQVRRMGEGFQAEMRSALDEPMRELRETADLARRAVTEVPTLDDDPPVKPRAPHSDPTPEGPTTGEATTSRADHDDRPAPRDP